MRAIDSLIEELIEEKTTEEMAMIASLNIKSNYVKKVIGERLGKSLTEIVEIIQETNSEILYDGIDKLNMLKWMTDLILIG